jgi:hypothetical protein
MRSYLAYKPRLLALVAVTMLAACARGTDTPVMAGVEFLPQRLGPTQVAIDGDRWLINGRPTYPGYPAEGLLMNIRMVNAVFEDDRPRNEWPPRLPPDFDPDANTDAFIAMLPEYVAYGVLGFTINLQGGLPDYEGAHNSAFDSDGSLRPEYLARVERLIRAADQQGAVIILGAFYQRQHNNDPTLNPRALAGREAIRAAVANTADWIRESGFTNVVMEISNEFNHAGFSNWQDGEWLRSAGGQVELIELARATHPELLVSTSGSGGATVPEAVAEAADFILLHTNRTDLSDYASRIRAAREHGKPVVINEDDKLGRDGARAAQLAVGSGAGWGAMLSDQNQAVPFMFEGAADDPVIYNTIFELTGGGPAAQDR